MGKFRGLDGEEGWIQRRFVNIERDLTELAAARRLVTSSAWRQVITTTPFPDGNFYTDYNLQNVPVPTGFTFATVNVTVAAQVQCTGSGSFNIGVQPRVAAGGGTAVINSRTGGGIMSAVGTLAYQTPVIPGSTFAIVGSVYFQSYGGVATQVAGQSNTQLSATIIFSRN